jgi:hypothetical protein
MTIFGVSFRIVGILRTGSKPTTRHPVQSAVPDIEEEVKKYPELMVCADLANRTKHAKLDRRSRVGATPRHRNVTVGGPQGTQQEWIIITDTGNKWQSLELARAAVKAWEILLSRAGLPIQ